MALTLDFDPSEPPRSSRQETTLEADRRRAFVAARRHTAAVRLMRLTFPLGALAVVGIYALTLAANWTFGSGQLRVGQVEITPDDLTMKNPSYFGQTQDGGRYEVRAKKAVLEFAPDAPIKLMDIDGDMTQANQVKTFIKARRGLFNNVKNELELFDGIEVDSNNGMRARLTRAIIYAKENRVVSKMPVHMSSPTGEIRGASMTLDTATSRATFIGKVSVRLVAAEPPPAAATPPAKQPQQPATPAFGRDSRQPVDVRAERFDLDDGAHTALFTGDVVATQGDSVLKAPELHIAYEGKAGEEFAKAGTNAQPGAQSSGLTRLVARTGVVVTSGPDRRITSDLADFDAKNDTALFLGNVLVNQGKNVLQGRRLFLDRKSGRTRLESPPEPGLPAGRIAASFYQAETEPAARSKSKSPVGDLEAGAQSMLGTFKADPTAPMDIEADSLEVQESVRQAIFRGTVKAQQGDFIVKAPEMVAFYSGQAGLGMGGAGTGSEAAKGSQVTRIEARQKVEITSKEGQTAKGDWATFDVKANTVLLGGHVVVTRGKDVAQGPRLKIDLTTGMYRFELDEKSAAAAVNAPQIVSPPVPRPATPDVNAPDPLATRQCPPGKQCVLFYPKEAQEKAKALIKKLPPPSGWEPNTSASPVQRGQ